MHGDTLPTYFRANGKLLLSGEYAVLDGALALALPTALGQTLNVAPNTGDTTDIVRWKSLDVEGEVWFEGDFYLPDWSYQQGTDAVVGDWLQRLGQAICRLSPAWLPAGSGWDVVTQLEFPRLWGLGSSSSLVALLAAWSGVDAYALLEASFGGSGYDIACAQAAGPILFQRHTGKPGFVEIPFAPSFQNQLYFLYLGQKQNSREGIARYRELAAEIPALTTQISTLTWALARAGDLPTFEALLDQHERVIADALQLDRVAERYFPDYWGRIKSLGAWGGDFVLVTSNRSEAETQRYFGGKGFSVFLPYTSLIRTR